MLPQPAVRERLNQARHTVAVIIIHGIGEQRPMETLRSFVEAVLPEPADGGEKYFSRPDPLSETFELRRLQNRTQPRVQFFEYYWAYKSEGARFSHILSWLSTLLFRWPSKVTAHLRPLWWISWVLIVVALVGAIYGSSINIGSRIPLAISAASGALLAVLQGIVLNFVGDVARYLSPAPQNIKMRQEIRSDGIRLLKKIHEEGIYDRVILVGHSLGSVIAYDILKHVWQEYAAVYQRPVKSDQPMLLALEKAGQALTEQPGEGRLQEYMKSQVRLWMELRDLGNPWLVTDLITLGSPLTHAAMLLASDEEDLRARERQRELPTDPPVRDMKRSKNDPHAYSYEPWFRYGPKEDIKLRALHDAALYACTRWTNLYFPSYANLFGDLVSGPLQPCFGPGVFDMAVRTGRLLRDRTIAAHLAYWKVPSTATTAGEEKVFPLALDALKQALDLDSTYYYEEKVEETP